MPTVRREGRSSFTAISRELLQNSELSFACRGLIAYLLSKPDDWICQTRDIEREGKIKEVARRTLFKEAEKAGYLTYSQGHDEKGHFTSAYTIHEIAVPPEKRTQSGESSKKALKITLSPKVDHPGTADPVPADPVSDDGGAIHDREVQNSELQNSELQKTTDSSLTKFEMNTVAPAGGEPGSLFENAFLGESAYPVETEITIPPQCANSDIAVHPAPPVSLDVAPHSLFAPLESGNSTPPVKRQPTRKSARKRATPPADPRAAHPAIVAYRDVTTRFPVKPVWNQIIEIVGLEPDLERMRACFVEWSARGGNPGNYSVWLRDWYVKNQIEEIKQLKEKKKANGFISKEQRERELREIMARHTANS